MNRNLELIIIISIFEIIINLSNFFEKIKNILMMEFFFFFCGEFPTFCQHKKCQQHQ
jgi:hypothetical protein